MANCAGLAVPQPVVLERDLLLGPAEVDAGHDPVAVPDPVLRDGAAADRCRRISSRSRGLLRRRPAEPRRRRRRPPWHRRRSGPRLSAATSDRAPATRSPDAVSRRRRGVRGHDRRVTAARRCGLAARRRTSVAVDRDATGLVDLRPSRRQLADADTRAGERAPARTCALADGRRVTAARRDCAHCIGGRRCPAPVRASTACTTVRVVARVDFAWPRAQAWPSSYDGLSACRRRQFAEDRRQPRTSCRAAGWHGRPVDRRGQSARPERLLARIGAAARRADRRHAQVATSLCGREPRRSSAQLRARGQGRFAARTAS